MAKTMKTWNGYEIVDETARNSVSELNEATNKLAEIVNNIPGAIIDVVELPETDIREGSFYRLVNATSYYGDYNRTEDTVICVNSLPEVGKIVTDAEISYLKLYCNIENNGVYGYVDDALASAFGFPLSGWVDYGTLCTFIGETYNGVVTHIDDAKDDASFRILLSYSLHVYKDGWSEFPYGYETAPEFDIEWDGEIGDRENVDISALIDAEAGSYIMVKISNEILTYNQIIGSNLEVLVDGVKYIEENMPSDIINNDEFGNLVLGEYYVFIFVDADKVCEDVGLPIGTFSNGVYFLYVNETNFITRLVAPTKVTKINSKFIDVEMSNLATVATTGSYNDLINKPTLATVATTGSYSSLTNKPTIYVDIIRYGVSQSLSSTSKSTARTNIDVYSKSEVDTKIANSSSDVDLSDYSTTAEVETMITNAIGDAIGGSY